MKSIIGTENKNATQNGIDNPIQFDETQAIPVGIVSYIDIDGCRFKREVLFCYDLKLPETFIPNNQDGEVESFKLLPVTLVVDIIQSTRPVNYQLITKDMFDKIAEQIDKYIKPEDVGYLKLLQSLTSGDCS
ncbi:hypothetical protein OSB04_021467 [Centaurea solstitialis]|uniref:Uncharacterized protein n=1 Tax=Centaurea solstitialis TaxID=347529 RepID=A0AA38SU87_9ASTR|nr:hypothetical protein OSB04_021467 [Centaurea solstitialis]